METAVVKWFRISANDPKKSMGFFILPDGRELFAHWGSRHRFSSRSSTPEFDHTSFPSRIPVAGDKVRYELGTSRKGPRARDWGFDDDYVQAELEIKQREEKTKELLAKLDGYIAEERLRCNPDFVLVEQEMRFGNPTSKPERILFQGTQAKLIQRLNPPSHLPAQPLQTVSGKILDGYQYVRWFERETKTGWERCGDPTKITLPSRQEISFELACAVLSRCQRIQRLGSFGGYKYTWRFKDENVANGSDSVTGLEIEFLESSWHLTTRFRRDDQALTLAGLGELMVVETPRMYRYSYW